MVAPRKYRNQEERESICADVREKLKEVPLTELEEASVEQILKTFAQQTGGQTLNGALELNSIGCVLEYVLPGRRILPQVMRIRKKTDTGDVARNE